MKFWKKEAAEETTKETKTTKKGVKALGKRVLGFVKRHKVLTVLLVLILCALAGFLFLRSKRNRMPNMEGMQQIIETTTVEKMDLANSISVTGTIASAEKKTGTTSLSNLEVEEVYVEVGDVVQEGDIICRFDSEDIEEALAVAKNNYSVNQQLDALNGDYETQYVETITEAEEDLADARETRDAYKAAYEDAVEAEAAAKTKLSKAKKALEEGGYQAAFAEAEEAVKNAIASYRGVSASAITDIQTQVDAIKTENNGIIPDELVDAVNAYDAAKSAYETAQKAVESAQSTYEKKKAATVAACEAYEKAQSSKEAVQDAYNDTVEKATETYNQEKLNAQLITDDKEAEEIEEYEEQLEDCVVYASMSGVITSLSVEAGETFNGGTIYEIQDQSNFIVEASVDEYDIVDLAKGMTAYVKTDSMGDVEMEAELTYVAPVGTSGMQMGSASGTASYELEITIKEPQERLRAGMTAQVSISLEESKDALAVPYDCVQTNEKGETVVYVEENGERKEVVVETGIETDYYTEIISDDIREGMTVYLGTQMIQSAGSIDSEDAEENMMFNFGGGGMQQGGGNGGGMPSGGGGMPSGGGPSGGGPGGF